MLTLLGKRMGKSCDGINRRSFLQVGSLGLGAGAFSLADINRAEAARAAAGLSTSRHKSVINIFLGGGPPHQDMFDLKPDAPTEIRGEFKPIATNVPGIQIGECFPRLRPGWTNVPSFARWLGPLAAMTPSSVFRVGTPVR